MVIKNTTPDPTTAFVGINLLGSGDGNPTYRKNNRWDDDPRFDAGFDWAASRRLGGAWNELSGLMGIFESIFYLQES